jgi:long-subunit fatty acid transport protein
MLVVKSTALLFLGALFFGLTAYGQATRSPFSAFGIGEYYGNSLAHNQGMAGVGISNPQYYYLNNKNPALLVFNNLTVFESGIVAENRTLKNDIASEKNGSGNINYLAFGFPVKRGRWSTSTGLMPYTNVNYKLNYTDDITGSPNKVAVAESGDGGINQVFWSNGVALNKTFSLGARINYLFGAINNTYANAVIGTQQDIVFVPTVYERYYYKDFNLSTGFSFHKDSLFKKNYRLNIGLTYDFSSNAKTSYYAQVERYVANRLIDSVAIASLSGSVTLPQTLGAGISFSKGDQITIGCDVMYLDYAQFRDFRGENPVGQGAWRVAVGGEVTPDVTSLGSYLKRVTYRTGVSMDQYPYLVNGNTLKDFGINFGLSLPVGRISSVDIGVKFGKRGDLVLNKIEENYVKLYFGVTFNDQWFIKRRFD